MLNYKLNGKGMIIPLIVGLIRKTLWNKYIKNDSILS